MANLPADQILPIHQEQLTTWELIGFARSKGSLIFAKFSLLYESKSWETLFSRTLEGEIYRKNIKTVHHPNRKVVSKPRRKSLQLTGREKKIAPASEIPAPEIWNKRKKKEKRTLNSDAIFVFL